MDLNILRSPNGKGLRTPDDVRIFDGPEAPADRAALTVLNDGVRGIDLAAPPVVLPDFHHKSSMEMPSSITVATRETIRPTLTSASVNCGMALIAFDMERPSKPAVVEFYRRVRERYPFPRSRRLELSAHEVLRAATEGGRFAVDRFDVDPVDLDRVELGGRLDLERYGGAARARRELPWLLIQLSRLRFGNVGPSNHFIELQEVEEILDADVAKRLGLRRGQVTLQYHNGGGTLATLVGLFFGRRKKFPRPHRAVMAAQKPLSHLATARSPAELRRRMELYFSGRFPPVPRFGPEGSRLLLANAAAMNYGFAYRLSTYATFRAFAREILEASSSHLVVDSPHNSIYEEEIDGETAVVHRHNSCRAYPAQKLAGHPVFSETGQPLLLPGNNRTSSYLCVADSEAHQSLYSACHGAGSIISDFERSGRSGPDPGGRGTMRFSYSDAEPKIVPHLDDRGIDQALGILTGNRLVRPVARLRPFAVMT